MFMSTATLRILKTAAVSIVASLTLVGCGKQQQNQAPPAPEVTVQTVESKPVPLELTYPARTFGSREVEVRARVGGIVLKRRFQEGTRVVQGQSMFLIDPEPVRARADSARAAVAVAKARAEEARRQRDRVLPLFEKNAVSQSRRDEAVSGFEVAQANLQSAESQLRMAQLDLEYTDVRAPITGLTSRETLSEGSLISTDQASSLLTKIVQVDPLYVEFDVPEAEAAMIRSSLAPANKSTPPPGAKLVLEDGSEYPQPAQVTFVDNSVDRSSGTVHVRAVLPNKDAQLLPGQFLRAKVEGIQLSNVVSVPRKAVMSGPQGSFVWVVGADSKAQMRPVQIGRGLGNNVIVTDGLQAGDRYIVEGVLKVFQPGTQVSAVSAEEAARKSQQAESQPAARKEAA
jgi:membrane fusion protein (multidrug efflux system)